MAPPRSAYEQWREKSSEVLKEVLPRGYIPEFPPTVQVQAAYTISLKMWLHPNPGPFGSTFGNPQTIGMIRYDILAGEWRGTTSGPKTGWVLYPDLASAAISMCAAHRLKGN